MEKGRIWYGKKQIQLQVLQEASKKASWSLLEARSKVMLFSTNRTVKQLASIDKSLEAQNDSYKWQNAPSDCARLFAPMMGPVAS